MAELRGTFGRQTCGQDGHANGSLSLQDIAHYSREYAGRVIELKISGEILDDPNATASLCDDLLTLSDLGVRFLVVTGGGKQNQRAIAAALDEGRITIPAGMPEKVDGLRVCTPEIVDITDFSMYENARRFELALNDAASRRSSAITPVCISGYDGGIVKATPAFTFNGDNMYTGLTQPELIDAGKLSRMIETFGIVVMHPIGQGADDRQRYNLNADTVAGAVARALGVARLIMFSPSRGVKRDGKIISTLYTDEVESLIETGVATDGMIPKLRECKQVADDPAVGGVAILPVQPGAILKELLAGTPEDGGTLICRRPAASAPRPKPLDIAPMR